MKRIMNLFVPHLVFWGLVTIILTSAFYRELPIAVNGIFLFLGICLIIFASKVALWWSERINEQRKSLANRFKISTNSARIILYGWWIRVPEVWVYRIFGFTISLLAAYHLYNHYSNSTYVQGLNNKSITGIIVNIFIIFFLIMWWLMAKGTPYRKTIVKMGVSWIIIVITYILSMSFHIAFSLITIVALLAWIYYIVKAWRAERRYKTQHH